MNTKGMNRRQFLHASGLAAGGAALAVSGAVLIARDGAWAMSLAAIGPHTAETLLVMTRRLYPHDGLADMYYARVVADLDAAAKRSPEVATLLEGGVAELDDAMGMPWLELSPGYQLDVLKKMERTRFFQKVRSTTVLSLYDDELVWRHFGYEGASFDFGGYIERGFDDLRWLPDPPGSASPRPG